MTRGRLFLIGALAVALAAAACHRSPAAPERHSCIVHLDPGPKAGGGEILIYYHVCPSQAQLDSAMAGEHYWVEWTDRAAAGARS